MIRHSQGHSQQWRQLPVGGCSLVVRTTHPIRCLSGSSSSLSSMRFVFPRSHESRLRSRLPLNELSEPAIQPSLGRYMRTHVGLHLESPLRLQTSVNCSTIAPSPSPVTSVYQIANINTRCPKPKYSQPFERISRAYIACCPKLK